MSDLRKAAQQALDALENHTAIKHPQQRAYRDEAISALRAALQDEGKPVAWVNLEAWKSGEYCADDCFSNVPRAENVPLYTAPPKQAPDAWLYKWANQYDDLPETEWQKGYEAARRVVNMHLDTPPQEPKPVGWASSKSLAELDRHDVYIFARSGFDYAVPLYTAPPQRPLLTEEEEEQNIKIAMDIFAELIVQECIERGNTLAKHYMDNHTERDQAMLLAAVADYSNEIKKHSTIWRLPNSHLEFARAIERKVRGEE